MVVRSRSGVTRAFPLVETIQKDSICHVTEAPAQVSEGVSSTATEIAERAVATLEGVPYDRSLLCYNEHSCRFSASKVRTCPTAPETLVEGCFVLPAALCAWGRAKW